jgi:hypothetical protein
MLRRLEAGEGGHLPPAEERWRRLLVDRNSAIRLAAEKFLFEALHGKSKPWEEPPTGPIKITVDVSKDHGDPAAYKVEVGKDAGEVTDPVT